MKIAINTSCAVAGGAITHLRHLLPEIFRLVEPGEVVLIGDRATRGRLGLLDRTEWEETPSIRSGLAGRLWFENVELPRKLREIGADVLFHPGNFAVFRSPIPQVILIHNLAPFLPEVIAGESWRQRLRLGILRWLTRVSLEQARATIFISQWGRSQVVAERDLDPDRMPIIPFGSEHGVSRPDSRLLDRWGLEHDGFLLTVSHLYRYKKLEKLIQAYADLGETMKDLPLIVVGEPYDEEYARRMEALAAKSEGRVVFTGGLDSEALGALMASCRIFVFTSEAENLPITLLEAMAAGCPILTNRACSMPEVCEDAAEYAEPPTAERYRSALAALLSDGVRRDRLRERARRRALHFSWPESAARTAAVLRKVGAVQ